MTLREFIEQVGGIQRAPPRTPQHHVGVIETRKAWDAVTREVRWLAGTAFLLSDRDGRLDQTLEQVGWTAHRGEAGREEPVYLVFLPVWD
jgi:hypothetical protein